jgi:hypothetical protein
VGLLVAAQGVFSTGSNKKRSTILGSTTEANGEKFRKEPNLARNGWQDRDLVGQAGVRRDDVDAPWGRRGIEAGLCRFCRPGAIQRISKATSGKFLLANTGLPETVRGAGRHVCGGNLG